MVEVKTLGIKAPYYYDPYSKEYWECEYKGDRPKVIAVWPGKKAVYIPPEMNENPNIVLYADLDRWEVKSNLEMFKEKIREVKGKRISDFYDWVCPFLGNCGERCEYPVIRPPTYRCILTGRKLDEIFETLGITNARIYIVERSKV